MGAAGGDMRHPTVIFVLGGPGSGKGTQCETLVQEFGMVHLSAGDLLRAHVKSGGTEGEMVARMIREGQIVPSEITIGLLVAAMHRIGTTDTVFLVDGFPRSRGNQADWIKYAGFDCAAVLFLECPEEVMEQRLLSRGESSGRTDDNIESIRKRFKTYEELTLPVLEHYATLGKLFKVDAAMSQHEVYANVRACAEAVCPPTVAVRAATTRLLNAIDTGDVDTYLALCDAKMTSFEPEAGEHLTEGKDFHEHFFKIAAAAAKNNADMNAVTPQSSICGYTSRVLTGGQAVMCAYTRLMQGKQRTVTTMQETRLWERVETDGRVTWICVHFHRSGTHTRHV